MKPIAAIFIIVFLLFDLMAQSSPADPYTSVYTQRLEDPLAVYFTDVAADGSKDVSDALQDAINRVAETIKNGVLFIPEGTYRISKTIYIWKGVRLIGYGKKRPVFVLTPNTPDYQEGNGKYMFHFCHDKPDDGSPIRDAWASTFYSGIRNVNIRIEPGNPAAIAVRFHIAQHCFLSHMDFYLNDGNIGVEDIGNEIEYCRFFGGDYGINTGGTSPGWQSLLIDSYFENQQKAAIRTHDAGLTIIRNYFKKMPTAIDIVEGFPEKLWISDSRFEEIGSHAIIISHESNPRTQINLENIVCINVPNFVLMRTSGQQISSSHKQYRMKEFVHGLIYEDLVNHPVLTTRHDMEPLKRLPPLVPSDIPLLPEVKTWVNIKSMGAVGDGISDDTEILEEAIARHQSIYLPSGHYRVTRPIVLKEHTILIGLNPMSTQIVITDSTKAYQGVGEPVPLLETPKGGVNIVTGIGLATTGVNPRVVAAKWMAGAKSMMNDVRFFEGSRKYMKQGMFPVYDSTPPDDEKRFRKWDTQYWSLWVTNGGGGTFKDIWIPDAFASAGMYISETSTPGRIYEMSVEHHVRHEVILNKVSNWKFFALQLEEEHPSSPYCLPLFIRNSNNLLFVNLFSYRVSRTIQPFPDMTRIENSTDLIFRGIHTWSWTKYAFENTVSDLTRNVRLRAREIAWLKVSGNTPSLKTNVKCYDAEKLAGGFEYIDGITCDSQGNIYFIDSGKQNIYCWNTDNKLSLISNLPIHPVSLACDKNDHLMVITRFVHPSSIFIKGAVDAVGFDPKHPETTIQRLEEVPVNQITGKTIFYQSSRYQTGRQISSALPGPINMGYISKDGTTIIPKTNDIGQTYALKKAVNGQPFYITNVQGHRTYKCHVEQDGSLSNPQLFVETGAPDIVTDTKGKIYIPSDNISVYNPDGKLVAEIKIPERPSTIIFGGKNFDTLFICAGSSLYYYCP
ncbi:MAG: glycosyl hydrolase family 28-related protein [Mangrovibacterium sp.]